MKDFSLLARCVALTLALGSLLVSCATGSSAKQHRQRGYLRLEVEPSSAEVEIDDEYQGIVEGWVEHVIPVQPGVKRLTLRAEGYLTQRFDIEVSAGEEVTLQLSLEPRLELPPDEERPRARMSPLGGRP